LYGYGWEILLLETECLAIFLCPLLDGPPFPKRAPPLVMLWLFRWLVFRIMLGAALIKLRGDTVWRDLTALYYHFESIASIKRSTAYAHKADTKTGFLLFLHLKMLNAVVRKIHRRSSSDTAVLLTESVSLRLGPVVTATPQN